MSRTIAVALALATGLAQTAQRVHADPASVVPRTDGAGPRIVTGVDYELDLDHAQISRERVGEPDADPLGAIPLRRELTYRALRHTVTPRVAVGVYRGVWLSFAAPIVLAQSSAIDVASGVDRTTASTFIDGILPAAGFDARSPGRALPGDTVFHSVDRHGVPELRGGIGYTVMDQVRDDTKPTWQIGVELDYAVGKVMAFDAVDPIPQTGVSTGVHELRLWTGVDRRLGRYAGWFEASAWLPIGHTSDSRFANPGFGATTTELAARAGASFGVVADLVGEPREETAGGASAGAVDARTGKRGLSVELGGRIIAHLEGRGYSELWEVFALAGDHRTNGPLVLDADPTEPGNQPLDHPGVSNLESYLETAGRLAVRGRVGRFSLAATAGLSWKTDHVISFADAGVDLPTCPTGAPRCEDDNNGQVSAGTQEVNPVHARLIDLVGHRYHTEDSYSLSFGLEARFAF